MSLLLDKKSRNLKKICWLIFCNRGEKDKTFIIEWALAEVFFKPHGGEPVQPDGWSYYQTNINGICLNLADYHANLEKTQGLVAEFINPKYEGLWNNLFPYI